MPTTLVIGADNQSMRLVLTNRTWYELFISRDAKNRNERQLIEKFLLDHGANWVDLEKVVLLSVSGSKTSVRVVKTILNTTAWFLHIPFYEHQAEDFSRLSRREIEALIA